MNSTKSKVVLISTDSYQSDITNVLLLTKLRAASNIPLAVVTTDLNNCTINDLNEMGLLKKFEPEEVVLFPNREQRRKTKKNASK